MTDNFNVVSSIELRIDGGSNAQQTLEGIEKEVSGLKIQFPQLGKLAQEAVNKVRQGFNAPIEGFGKAVDNVKSKFSELQEEIKQTAEQAKIKGEEIKKEYDRVAERQGIIGDAASGATGILGGITGILGNSEVSSGAFAAADILDALESLPKFKVAFQGFAETLKSSGGIFGGLAAIAGNATAGLGGFSSALVAVGAAALPLVVAGGVIYGLVSAFSRMAEEAEKAKQAQISLIVAQNESLLKTNELSKTNTKQQLEEKKKEIEQELATRRSFLDPLLAERQNILKAQEQSANGANALYTALNSLGFERGLPGLDAANKRLEVLSEATKPLQADIDKLVAKWFELVTAIQYAQDDPKIQEEAAKNVTDRITIEKKLQQELITLAENGTSAQIKARIKAAKDEADIIGTQLAELNKISNPTEGVKNQIAALNQRLTDLTATSYILETRTLAVAEAREKEIKILDELKNGFSKMATAAKESERLRDEIADLEKEQQKADKEKIKETLRSGQIRDIEEKIKAAKAGELETERNKRITDLQRKNESANNSATQSFRDNLSKINQAYFDSELKALTEFRQSELRINDDFARDQKRKLEDLNTDLKDLAANRDVSGFINRQKQGATDITRSAEDFGVSAQRRAEDFGASREAAAQAREVQISDLKANFEKERGVRLAEQQKTLQQELDSRNKAQTESQKLEDQLSILKRRFAEEDAATRLAEEKKSFNDRRNALQKSLAEQTAILAQGFFSQLGLVNQFVTGGINYLKSLVNSVPIVPTTKLKTPIVANAEGGIYNTPTISLLGEKRGWIDVVLPVKQSEGIERAMARFTGKNNNNITVNYNPQVIVGDIASKSEVYSALKKYERDLINSLEMAVKGSA